MQQLSFQKPLVLAIAEGATTPDPGQAGVTVWSSTLSKLVYWTGSIWTAVDKWTYIKLASDFTTSSGTAVDVTGMAFTPEANKTYIIESHQLMRSANASIAPRVGVDWPAGSSDGAIEIKSGTGATGRVIAYGNPAAAVLCQNTSVGDTTGSWLSNFFATLIMGGSPSGTFKMQLAAETGGTNVTLKAGTWMRYRTI